MEASVTQLNIKVILVSPTNHKSLQAEHGIKSLSGLLVNTCQRFGVGIHAFPTACYAIMPIQPQILMGTVHMSWYLDTK